MPPLAANPARAGPAPMDRLEEALARPGSAMPAVVGVDGARLGPSAGWVAVRLEEGRLAGFAFHAAFAEVLAANADVAVVGVDMPIGHEDPAGARQGGRRRCDAEAQAFVGPRRASVFPVPPLDLFDLPTHAEALRAAAARGVAAPSAQVWNLRDRLREVNALAAKDPRVHEVHPEASFTAMARGHGAAALEHPKHTWNGLFERLDLLRHEGLRPARSLGGVGRASPDDVLDATAAAWSARRIAAGQAARLPEPPPLDPATGRAVAIWV